MTDNFIDKYNKALSALIIYCVSIFVMIGLTYKRDVEDAMVRFVTLYGIPLLGFLILYIVITTIAVYKRFTRHRLLTRTFFHITIKIILAALPMFFLDNRMAAMLHYLNDR